MTINEAIATLDSVKHNTYTTEDKIRWLSELDGRVYEEIIKTHKGCSCCGLPFYGYEAGDVDEDLIIPAPYDSAYIHWVSAQIDRLNHEYGNYNNEIAAFTAVYDAYARDYTRTHMPISHGDFYI